LPSKSLNPIAFAKISHVLCRISNIFAIRSQSHQRPHCAAPLLNIAQIPLAGSTPHQIGHCRSFPSSLRMQRIPQILIKI